MELLTLALEILEELLCMLASTPLEAAVAAVVLETELLERPHHWGLPLEVAEWVELEQPRLEALRLFLVIDLVAQAEQR